jgi:hypothetical protein
MRLTIVLNVNGFDGGLDFSQAIKAFIGRSHQVGSKLKEDNIGMDLAAALSKSVSDAQVTISSVSLDPAKKEGK